MADTARTYTADEIRERTDLVAVISRHVALKKSGKKLSGLCPFHQERTPSFTVDAEKQLWFCFGCQSGGNVFHFLMKAEGLSFPEAAERLAREAGLPLAHSAEQDRRRSERDILATVNLAAARFYRDQLNSSSGVRARELLEKRGVSPALTKQFGLGYAPAGWEVLWKHLRASGYEEQGIVRAGLALPRSQGQGFYDRFRDRLVFPILDLDRRVLGFGGRILSGDEVKYLNSPETPLFQKGRTLYGLPYARARMAEAGRAILVEGYLDLIACHQFGFTEAVATLGTALTAQHLEIIRRQASRVYVAFDSDSAGLAATMRARPLFTEADLEVRVVTVLQDHDPDSWLHEAGEQAFQQALDESVGMVEWQLRRLAQKYQGQNDEERLGLIREAVPILTQVEDAFERAHYVKRLAEEWCHPHLERMSLMEEALHQELRRRSKQLGKSKADPLRTDPIRAAVGMRHAERDLLAAILQDAKAAEQAVHELEVEDFQEALHRQIFESIRRLLEQAGALSAEAVISELEPGAVTTLVTELAMIEPHALSSSRALSEVIDRLKRDRLAGKVRALGREAEPGWIEDPEGQERLRQLHELARARADANGRKADGDPGRRNQDS